MKRGFLITTLSGLMMIGAFAWYGGATQEKEYYQPREQKVVDESAKGSAEYLLRRRANVKTGKIELADVLAAERAFEAMPVNKNSALGLQWQEFGPTNLGGRTRSLIFDKDDPNIMFMGSVSGGIYKSTNGGRSWNEVDDKMSNLAISSLAQSSDGTIYAGTGENLYYFAGGRGSGGMLGAGMYKSTDMGATFTQMPSTAPSGNGREDWTAVGKIEVDPNDPLVIYAATNGGLKMTVDGGLTWTSPIPGNASCTDMVISSTGVVYAKQLDRLYKVTNQGQNALEITNNSINQTGLPRNNPRMRVAVAPQDENFLYAVAVDNQERFKAAYKSTDAGNSWTTIGTRNQLLNPHRSQGTFNNSLAVDPKDKNRLIVGGTELWEYSDASGWFQIATLSRFSTFFYVHADNHFIDFHPTNLNTIFICNDGGLFKSTDDGVTFSMENKGYATIQYYGIDVFLDGAAIGGTQDNSNIKVDPNGPLPKSGERFNSGDGGLASVSHLDPEVFVIASQYGNLRRTVDGGDNLDRFFSNRVLGNRRSDIGDNAGFADFVTPFDMHEDFNDLQSADSVELSADTIRTSIGFGNGGTSYAGSFVKPQQSVEFVPESFVIIVGADTLTTDVAGNISGSGNGTFDPVAGSFTVTLDNPTNLEIRIQAATRYAPGAIVRLESLTEGITLIDTLPNGLNPGESIQIQDPVQNLFAVGLTAYDWPSQPNNKQGGVWMTRDMVSNKNAIPEWWHIGELANNERPIQMAFSGDGDVLLVATNQSRVYRFSNLDNARSFETADIDELYTTNPPTPSSSVIQSKVIFNGQGREVTTLAFDPDDNDRIIIGLGNYGSQDYIYYTNRGTSPNLNNALFDNVTSNLPPFPVYDAVFNYNDPTGGEVILGTEYGILATSNIDGPTVDWFKENTGMPNVPVFDLVQTRNRRPDLVNQFTKEGSILAGTHGRGIFKTGTTSKLVSLDENNLADSEEENEGILSLYPNPANEQVNVELSLKSRSDVSVSVRDLSGKLIKTLSLKGIPVSTDKITLPVNDLKAGNYIIMLSTGSAVQTGKLAIVR
jgi:hypothetical protein